MIPTLPSWSTLKWISPEIFLAIGMCAVILVPFLGRRNVVLVTLTAVASLVLALVAAVATVGGAPAVDVEFFHGTLTIDSFSQFFKILLTIFTLLVVLQWWLTNRNGVHAYDLPDFLCLLLGAALGMSLMASASNLLMILIATETASFPSFALAGFRKRTKLGSEGSIKYVVFGAAASAVSIYGMSLIYGAAGSLDLGAIADVAAKSHISPLMAVGLAALLAGIAFKLSAVPLHFWCPDVFQGAPTEVTTFLSVASKGGAVCLLVRVLGFFGSAPATFTGLAVGVGILGAVTATWGNLVALHQTNFKRLLAYSSIAHAGYMIMGASVIAAVGPESTLQATDVTSAILFYLMVYLFMNMGAFTVIAEIARRQGTEDIRDYAGLLKRSPAIAVLLSIFLLSLFGMPGLGGFMGKIFIGAAVIKVHPIGGFALAGALLINTLLSLYYYMRPIYFMVLKSDEENRPTIVPSGAVMGLLGVCCAALIWTGLVLGNVDGWTRTYGTLNTVSRTPVSTVDAGAVVPAIGVVTATPAQPAQSARAGH